MFRPMVRQSKQLTKETCVKILREQRRGVLSPRLFYVCILMTF
jgi:hypothetical protein